MVKIDKRTEIIFHFNKMHLQDANIPMWVIKAKGETYYVEHVDMEVGVGFSTKETPDNPSSCFNISMKSKKDQIIFKLLINVRYLYIKRIMCRKKTSEEFINKSKIIHGDNYNYDNVIYKTNSEKVDIICKIHGSFFVRPNDHLNKKSGCPKCVGKYKDIKSFIEESKIMHGDKYDYSKSVYKSVDEKLIINCPLHGDFEQTPYIHYNGGGCSKCRSEFLSKKFAYSTNVFIEKAKLKHGNKYDYSLVEYIKGSEKIEIKCPKHGIFLQTGASHLSGKGCPICKESKGEKIIRLYLVDNNILFLTQHKFDECINNKTKRKLPFDFYLPDYNICIEFDGKQHFTTEHGGFGANKENTILNFERLKNNDLVKTEYCRNNQIELLRISYKEDIIIKLKSRFNQIQG